MLTAWFNLLSVQCFSVCVRRRLWWRGAIGTSLRGIDGIRGALCLCRFLSAVKINGVPVVVRESSLLSLLRRQILSTSAISIATSQKGSGIIFHILNMRSILFFAIYETLGFAGLAFNGIVTKRLNAQRYSQRTHIKVMLITERSRNPIKSRKHKIYVSFAVANQQIHLWSDRIR